MNELPKCRIEIPEVTPMSPVFAHYLTTEIKDSREGRALMLNCRRGGPQARWRLAYELIWRIMRFLVLRRPLQVGLAYQKWLQRGLAQGARNGAIFLSPSL